jgi:hypothetical protein
VGWVQRWPRFLQATRPEQETAPAEGPPHEQALQRGCVLAYQVNDCCPIALSVLPREAALTVDEFEGNALDFCACGVGRPFPNENHHLVPEHVQPALEVGLIAVRHHL